MSAYVSKRIASVQTRNGSSLWYLLEDAKGEEKKVSPAGFDRTPVPDTTPDHVKKELLKQLLLMLPMRERVEFHTCGIREKDLDAQLAWVKRAGKQLRK